MKITLSLCSAALVLLCACTSSKNLAVGDGASAAGAGKSPCKADVTCLPNGNCLVTCTGPNGKKCEIEMRCDEKECEVLSCEGGGCK